MTTMPKNGELWKVVRGFADGKKVAPAVRDQFLFAAMSDLRDRIDSMEAKVGKIWTVYQALALLWVPAIVAIVVGLVTGTLRLGPAQ